MRQSPKILLALSAALLLAPAAEAQTAFNPCVKIGTNGSCQGVSTTFGMTTSPVPSATITTITGTNTVTLPSSTVPRQLIFAQATYTTSATVGNRYLRLGLYNGAGTLIGDWTTSAAMTASGTYLVDFLGGTFRESAFDTNKTIQTPFPAGLVIPAGYTLKVFDLAGVSATDAETVSFQTTQGAGQ